MKNLTLHTFKLKYTKTVGKQGHERMNVYDLCADKELIYKIEKELNMKF